MYASTQAESPFFIQAIKPEQMDETCGVQVKTSVALHSKHLTNKRINEERTTNNVVEIEAVEDVEPGFATNPSGTFIITINVDGSKLIEVPDSGFMIEFSADYEAIDPADNEQVQQSIESAIGYQLQRRQNRLRVSQ